MLLKTAVFQSKWCITWDKSEYETYREYVNVKCKITRDFHTFWGQTNMKSKKSTRSFVFEASEAFALQTSIWSQTEFSLSHYCLLLFRHWLLFFYFFFLHPILFIAVRSQFLRLLLVSQSSKIYYCLVVMIFLEEDNKFLFLKI